MADFSVLSALRRVFNLGKVAKVLNLGSGCLAFVIIGSLVGALVAAMLPGVFEMFDRDDPDELPTSAEIAAVSDWAGSFGGWADSQSLTFVVPDIDTGDVADAPPPTQEPAALTPIVSSGSWQFTQFEGQMDCDGLVITIPQLGTTSGEIAVLEDGRLLGSGIGEDLAEVLAELDEDAPEPNTYVGAIAPQDGLEGVELVFTITFIDDEHATTHIGGAIVSDGVTCSVDRPGEATFTG